VSLGPATCAKKNLPTLKIEYKPYKNKTRCALDFKWTRSNIETAIPATTVPSSKNSKDRYQAKKCENEDEISSNDFDNQTLYDDPDSWMRNRIV
jgi:hypothetical protein